MALIHRRRTAPEKLEDWLFEATSLMARTGCSLEQAATILQHTATSDDIEKILRRASFIKLLWEARHRFFTELAEAPNWQKNTAVGKLMVLAQKLEEEGSYDKAAEVIFKASKLVGWVGVEGQVNVFGELTQKDLDKIREDLAGAKINGSTTRVN